MPFSFDALASSALSGEADFVFLLYSCDYAASNARLLLALEANIAGLNADFVAAGQSFRIRTMEIFCGGHIGTNLVSTTFSYEQQIFLGFKM